MSPPAVTAAPPVPTRLGRRPALDGVRGLAWSVVFVAHAWVIGQWAIGQPAMFVFFALSGFLITTLLLEEHRATGRISLRNFFVRRSLRLLPALTVFLVIWLLVVLAAGSSASWTATVPGSGAAGAGTTPLAALEGVAGGFGYVTNWLEVLHAYVSYVPLGHLWSLAVEEQFYLLWAPLLLLAVLWKGRRGVLGIAAVLALASVIDAVAFNQPMLSLGQEMSTQTRAGAFLAGAVVAALCCHRLDRLAALARLRTILLLGALAVMGWAAWVFANPVAPRTFDAAWVATTVAAAGLVVVVLVPRPASRPSVLEHPVAIYLGQRSYALYLWHYVWLTWLHGLGLLGIGLALGASLACAEASWRLVEAPALALKGRFSAKQTEAVAEAAARVGGPPATPTEPRQQALLPS